MRKEVPPLIEEISLDSSKEEKIVYFLRSRPLINIRGLEKRLEVPQNCISKAVNGYIAPSDRIKTRRKIPEKYLGNIERVLVRYGFIEWQNEMILNY